MSCIQVDVFGCGYVDINGIDLYAGQGHVTGCRDNSYGTACVDVGRVDCLCMHSLLTGLFAAADADADRDFGVQRSFCQFSDILSRFVDVETFESIVLYFARALDISCGAYCVGDSSAAYGYAQAALLDFVFTQAVIGVDASYSERGQRTRPRVFVSTIMVHEEYSIVTVVTLVFIYDYYLMSQIE